MSSLKIKSIQQDDSNSQIRKKIMNNTKLSQTSPRQLAKPSSPPKLYIKQQPITQNRPSTDRNMKFKLDQLQQALNQLRSDLHNVRQDCRELTETTSLLKNNLVYQDLLGLKGQLSGKIQGFSNQIRQERICVDQRYKQIRSNCTIIWQKTEELTQNVFQLTMAIQRIEQKLGFKQIYRLELL